MAQSRLRPIAEGDVAGLFGGEEPIPDQRPSLPQPPPRLESPNVERAATAMLFTALRALSQRSLVALADLFTLAVGASAWLLWRGVMPDPSTNQLIGLGIYGLWALALVYLARRR